MPKIDMAVMEVQLPDATLAKNVDIQLLKVEFMDDVYKIFNQELVLPKSAQSATFVVPEGSVYTLALGYADVQNDGTKQISWGVPVQLTHTDELLPDAPGPFGAIRMIDEIEGELRDPGAPDTPGADNPPADPVIDPPVEDKPEEEPPVPDESVDDPDSGSGGPIENIPVDDNDSPQGGHGQL